ncbi:unnamed protein product, partial [Schistosoma turkestanicum]
MMIMIIADSFVFRLVNTSGCVSGTVSASDSLWSNDTADSAVNTTFPEDNDDDDDAVDGADDLCSNNQPDPAIINNNNTPASIIPATCQIFLHVAGLIDVKMEQKRCEHRLMELKDSIDSLERKRQNPTYSQKVPMKTQLMDTKKLYELNSELEGLKEVISNLNDMKPIDDVDHSTLMTSTPGEILFDALCDYLGVQPQQQQQQCPSTLVDLEA